MRILEAAAEAITPLIPGLSREDVLALLELPPRPEMGDVAFPCFTLAKTLRKAPAVIATDLANELNMPDGAASVEGIRTEALGPYVNLFFEPTIWGLRIASDAFKPDYGHSQIGSGQRVVIDLSSPNIAKPFGVGHLRSTVIGSALANLYSACGWDVVKVNHIGDWGTQFGKLMEAYQRWGDNDKLNAEPIKESLRLYVRFHEEAERDPSLEDAGRDWFRRLEQGDPEAERLWRYFVGVSMEEFDRVYARLGVKFDHVMGESFYNDKMSPVVDELRDKGLLEESDGAQVVRLEEEGLPPCLILKSDGTTIYPTRDLATAIYRKSAMGADRILYVVGAEQTLHFNQVFAVLRLMGHEWADSCEHVPFGLIKVQGKKMSTRKGKVVFLDEVLDEAVQKAHEVASGGGLSPEEAIEVAKAVGIGAVIFDDLRGSRMSEIDFSLDEMLRFDGDTGPYVQYTYARAASLIEKGKVAGVNPLDFKELEVFASVGSSGWACLKAVDGFPDAVREAVRLNEPSVVARHLLDTAKAFNRFYRSDRILTNDPVETATKLQLTAAIGAVLRIGLGLLGVGAPVRM
ncbi:arginine--tRNA ligase [Paenibacillus sp. SN-8-1]|uniref:arginine--tRNA ligase n=1 Tax=Paenibacillus sp. SN-8-1 TaxID=3435409 RepID=UPI003D9A9699